MKNFLLIVFLVILGWVMYKGQSKQSTIIPIPVGNSPRIGNPGVKLLTPQAKETRILAITLTVKSAPEQLPSGRLVHNEIRVYAPATNSGSVYLGDTPASCSSGPRYEVGAGANMPIKISECSRLYMGGTAGDTLSIYGEIES